MIVITATVLPDIDVKIVIMKVDVNCYLLHNHEFPRLFLLIYICSPLLCDFIIQYIAITVTKGILLYI